MGPWILINDGVLEPSGMYLFSNKEGTYLFASGQQKDEVIKNYAQLTHYRLFCEAPSSP